MTSQVNVYFSPVLPKTKFFQMDFSAINFAPSSNLMASIQIGGQLFELLNALPEISIISFLHRENRTFLFAFFRRILQNFTKSVNLIVRL